MIPPRGRAWESRGAERAALRGAASGAGFTLGDQLSQELDRRLGGPLLAGDERLSPLAEPLAELRPLQTAPHEARQLTAVLHDHCGLASQQGRDDVTEIPGIGAEGDGGAVGRRFDHVLAATAIEAATDKGDIGDAPPGA